MVLRGSPDRARRYGGEKAGRLGSEEARRRGSKEARKLGGRKGKGPKAKGEETRSVGGGMNGMGAEKGGNAWETICTKSFC